MKVFLVLLSILVYEIRAYVLKSNDTTIQLIHVFFRHGDRTPDKKDFYPTDPYRNHDFYPMGLGQLTNKGKDRAYNFGRVLRKRYGEFLGDIYTPNIIESISSDYDRTKMSLLLVLAGLWPPKSLQQWHNSLLWQPIPFNYQPKASDHIIQRPNTYCPKYFEELNKTIENQGREFVGKYKKVFEYVQKWTEKEMNIPIDMFNVYQNLNSEDSLNLELPKWTKEVYPEPLQSIAGMQCYFENFNDILKRLNGGHSLKIVLENGSAKIKDELVPKGRKIYLFSGHENNVVNVLAAMNLFKPHVPKYSSAVIFELHRINSTTQYGYKIYYYDQKSDEPELLKLYGCEELCEFDKFIELTANHIPLNYTAECESVVNLN